MVRVELNSLAPVLASEVAVCVSLQCVCVCMYTSRVCAFLEEGEGSIVLCLAWLCVGWCVQSRVCE